MDLIQRLTYLEKADLFAFVQAECLAKAALAMTSREVLTPEILYEQSEPADFAYLLCQGSKVRLRYADGVGYEVSPGECFGYEEIFSEAEERHHGARCLGACILLRLEHAEALSLAAEDPGLFRGAIKALMLRRPLPPA
ncbi:MAG: cyclic nucleotide-binding domain-containing protein [Pseudomonadota bacterium]